MFLSRYWIFKQWSCNFFLFLFFIDIFTYNTSDTYDTLLLQLLLIIKIYFCLLKIYYMYDHRCTEWKCTTSEFMAVEMDGAVLIIFVQCFVGVTSLLAQQTTQLIMVSGNLSKNSLVRE